MSKGKPTAVDILYQDIQHLEQQVSDLTAQLQRTQRLIKIDEREAAVGEQQSRTELIRAINANTKVVGEMVQEARENDGVEDHTFYRLEKRRKLEKSNKRLVHLRRLADADQRLTEKCPCGEHKGLMFLGRLREGDNLIGKKVFIVDREVFGTVSSVRGDGVVFVKVDDEREEQANFSELQIVLDEVCPKWWWIAQSRMAYEDGTLGQFARSTPISKYLAPLTLKKNSE